MLSAILLTKWTLKLIKINVTTTQDVQVTCSIHVQPNNEKMFQLTKIHTKENIGNEKQSQNKQNSETRSWPGGSCENILRKRVVSMYTAHFCCDTQEAISTCSDRDPAGRLTRPITHLFNIAVFAWLVDKLSDGHEHRQHETSGQDDEDAPDVFHTQGAGLFSVLFGTSVTPPPFLLHHVKLSFLLELQDGDGHLVSVGWACKESDGSN